MIMLLFFVDNDTNLIFKAQIGKQSALIQVMACGTYAISHYLNKTK